MNDNRPDVTAAATSNQFGQGKIDHRPQVPVKPVLVVVDMQPLFPAANCPTTIAAVEAEIKAARDRQEPIVVLEMAVPSLHHQFHPTHKCLLDVLDEPGEKALWVRTLKFTMDGSNEVLTAYSGFGFTEVPAPFRRIDFSKEHFRVVGVNTSESVYKTAVGIARSRPGARVEVLAHAVNDSSIDPWDKYEMIASMVQVV
jgi:nicotinamidase-related amidase